MNTITSRSVARRSDIGKIAFNTEDDEWYLCCTSYDYPSWLPLGTLSGANWMRHRGTVADILAADKLKGIELERKGKDNIGKLADMERTRQMLKELFDKMSPAEKKEFLKGNNNTWLANITCTVCLNTCKAKKKCVHLGCGGMCQSCHDAFQSNQKEDKECPCCGESQCQMCPICQEKKEQSQLVKADGGCGHSVCWVCFGRAYKAGHPIKNCPLCRGVFAGPTIDSDNSSDIESEDDMSALEDEELVNLQYDHAIFLANNNNGIPQPELYLSDAEIQQVYGALSAGAAAFRATVPLQHQLGADDESEMIDEIEALMERGDDMSNQ